MVGGFTGTDGGTTGESEAAGICGPVDDIGAGGGNLRVGGFTGTAGGRTGGFAGTAGASEAPGGICAPDGVADDVSTAGGA
jgi:hypothetical protein